MARYILKRIWQAIPIVIGVAALTFVLFYLLAGDPILQLLGKHASAGEIKLMRQQYGLDQPWWKQFFTYVWDMLRFDFGRSFHTKQNISLMLKEGLGVSLALTVPAFLMSSVLSVALGLISALYHNRFLDRFLVLISIVGMSISSLAFILFGQYILAFKWGWFPISGFESGWTESIRYLALPWLIWVAASVGGDLRFFRTAFLEEMQRPYVFTARAKGASTYRIMRHHVLPNAYLPMITRLVLSLPFLFLGSLLLENFFSIPGLGNLIVTAFHNADWPVVKAMTFLGALVYIATNLMSDILYAWADPRVRLQ